MYDLILYIAGFFSLFLDSFKKFSNNSQVFFVFIQRFLISFADPACNRLDHYRSKSHQQEYQNDHSELQRT